MRVTDKYVFFWRGWPGQWFRSPFKDANGIEYRCAEQYMMSEKARLFNDMDALAKILITIRPKEQQDIGRSVKNFNQQIWDKNARRIVYEGNILKFEQHPNLKELMLATGNRLFVEASPSDLLWGVGLEEEDLKIDDPAQWRGTNWLGEVLTKVRDYLKKEKDKFP